LTIERLPGYHEIDISPETIDTTKAQARQTSINKNVAELALSIKTQGLFSPILVVDSGEQASPRYELIAGQRRMKAHRDILAAKDSKFQKIGAFCYKPTMEDWEKKAISINENFNQEPMSDEDRIAAVTACYVQFDSISITSRKTGISEGRVRKYVKFMRLPACLKKLVEDGTISIATALDTANLFGFDTPDIGETDEKEVIDCAKEQDKLTSKQKKRVGEIHREKPEKPIIDVIGGVKERQPTTKKLTIEVESTTYSNIGVYAESKKIKTNELAATELIDEGLKSNDIE
jgi:ParB/RepB/Spo0J family partition protein